MGMVNCIIMLKKNQNLSTTRQLENLSVNNFEGNTELEPKELLSPEVPFLLFSQIWHFVKSIKDERSSVCDSLLLLGCVLLGEE